MNDRVIRQYTHAKILHKFYDDGESLIFDEFPVCDGLARADIAVVNGELHAYEIKSTQDNLTRLPNQIESYSKVFDRVTLIADVKHITEAKKIIPSWWGILVISGRSSAMKSRYERQAKKNPSPEPLALAQLLWVYEARLILEGHGLFKGLGGKPRHSLWQALVDNFSLKELNWLVRESLKMRAKNKHMWERTPPSPQPLLKFSFENFLESLTIAATAQTQCGD